MVEVESIALMVTLMIALAVVTLLLINYYMKYSNLVNDQSKYVILRDLDGHKKKIGRFYGHGSRVKDGIPYYTVQVINAEQQLEEWLIELDRKYTIGGVALDYGSEEYMIFCDFYRSDFKAKIIRPLCDLEILKLGLTGGVRAISAASSPLILQIKQLQDEVRERDGIIQQKTIEFDRRELEYIHKLGFANQGLLDEIKREYLIAAALANAKIQQKRKEELRGELAQSIENTLDTIEQRVEKLKSKQDGGQQ
ncbi:MAG: hypothetical protein ACTSRS_07635 [Candidatus Helarchaeota archaeon]